MKQLKNIKYLLAATLILAVACKKVITLNLNNAAPQVVIEGNVTNQPGPYQVTITKSVAFYNSNVFPVISGAEVTITDSNLNIVDSLTENPAGTYSTSKLVGTIGHTYILDVKNAGQEFRASSTMPQQINMDSITFISNSGFGKPLTNPVINFQDPAGVYNAYNFVETINGMPSKQIFLFDDRLSDGKYVTKQLFNDSNYIRPGDMVTIEMQCIDKNVFSYLKELSNSDPTNGQPTSPADPTTNLSNGALGYFSAHTSQKKSAVFH